jgi:uncharacterized protein HemY
MKTLNELLSEIHHPELVFALGGVAIAHGDRARARQKLKESEVMLKEAAKDRATFGMYDDCGDHYHSKYDRGEALMQQALDEKRAKEKHFKKLCYQYVELGGNRETIDEMIEILNSVAV